MIGYLLFMGMGEVISIVIISNFQIPLHLGCILLILGIGISALLHIGVSYLIKPKYVPSTDHINLINTEFDGSNIIIFYNDTSKNHMRLLTNLLFYSPVKYFCLRLIEHLLKRKCGFI